MNMQTTGSDLNVSTDAITEESAHYDEIDDDTEDDSDDMSEYEEGISFHNACREFYRNRKSATESFKHNMVKDNEKRTEVNKKKKSTSIDDSMERLRREMASLMDQDLTLMEQLLNLNETIEDIKVKRLYGSSRESFYSSCDLNSGSDWSLSDSRSGCFRGSKFFSGTATVDMSSTENIADTSKNRKNVVQRDSGYNSP